MKSLLLTVLYLMKDTVNRWVSRLSSPLARVLVVFFLSLCALVFLGSYVISAKLIRDRIIREGGDLVQAMVFPQQGGARGFAVPSEPELQRLLDADSFSLRSIGSVRSGERRYFSLYTYDFRRSGQLMPLLAPGGGLTLLCPPELGIPEGPIDLHFDGAGGMEATAMVRHLEPNTLPARLLSHGGVIVSPETAQDLMGQHATDGAGLLMLRLHNPQSAADLLRAENYIKNFFRLEGVSSSVNSAAKLMGEMDIVLGNQSQCRAAFCLGIVVIVGILLTALAGIEYRQNEYIYTLMKSFGIHPLLLVSGFVAENVVLVGASFAAAVLVFLETQHIILQQFFKLSGYALTLREIMPEMQLIAATLGLCVLVSALPVIAAANREIGRVLK